MSIERSKGSHSRLRVSVRSWSRFKHLIRPLDEHLEQVEFHAGQRNLVTVGSQ